MKKGAFIWKESFLKERNLGIKKSSVRAREESGLSKVFSGGEKKKRSLPFSTVKKLLIDLTKKAYRSGVRISKTVGEGTEEDEPKGTRLKEGRSVLFMRRRGGI